MANKSMTFRGSEGRGEEKGEKKRMGGEKKRRSRGRDEDERKRRERNKG